jgi:type I restriction enzyme S subunit
MSNLVPDGWRAEKLDKISRVVDSAHQTPIFSDAGYPMVRVGDIKGGKITLENTKYVPQDIFEIFTKNHKPTFNDLLMTRVGSYGRCSIVKSQREFCLGQNTVVINPQSVDSDYLYYFLQTENINNQIEDTVGGSSQKSLSLGAIKSLNILTPVKPEQQKIAQILTSVDEVIEKTQAQIDKLKDLKTAMTQELLTKGIGHLEFKDSPVGRIPVGWEVKTIEEVTTDVTYGLTVRPKYIDEGVPLVSGKECKDGWLDFSISNKISDSDFGALRTRSLPKVDDVIMTKTGTVGRVALVRKEYPAFAISQNVALLTPNKSQVVPAFLELLLTSQIVKEQIRLGISTLSIPDLQLGVLKNFQIPLPNQNEQEEITLIINSTKTKINYCNNKLSSLLSLKKALMQDLLTGKVRVTTE